MQLIGTLTTGRTIRRTNNTYTADRGKQHLEAISMEELNKLIEAKNKKNKYSKMYPAFNGLRM